jgi:histidinol phosphatase-like PHP family hydrolase
MCDKDCQITGDKSASKQASGSDEITSPTIKNDLADIKAAMTEMMSSFKTELLSHVNASISQVYQDFEQAAEQAKKFRTTVLVSLKLTHCQNTARIISLIKSQTLPKTRVHNRKQI